MKINDEVESVTQYINIRLFLKTHFGVLRGS